MDIQLTEEMRLGLLALRQTDQIQHAHMMAELGNDVGMPQGLPLGFGWLNITTKDPRLRALLGAVPGNQSDYDHTKAQFQDQYGATWQFRRKFLCERQWLGECWEVTLWTNLESGKVIASFVLVEDFWTRLQYLMNTHSLGSQATLVQAEEKARQRLNKELTPEQRAQLLLCGGVWEQGHKSRLWYLIRPHRPTLAMRKGNGHDMTLLCALCLHPGGYYSQSWAGILPPSDAMLAHLLMIKTDEHLYWRKANQIPGRWPNSGI